MTTPQGIGTANITYINNVKGTIKEFPFFPFKWLDKFERALDQESENQVSSFALS